MKNHHNLKVISLAALAFGACLSARAQGITNNFTTPADYVANGIVGEINWDGVYLGFGDIPNGNPGGSGNGSTIAANDNIPSTLTLVTTRGDWAGAGDDGFFLWKLVTGDFDVSVESLPNWDTTANNFGGLLVRAYATNNSGAPFSTTETNAAENWLMLWRGQEFGIDEVRFATNGGDNERTFGDSTPNTNQTRFFRIVRSQSTNFMFYWKTNYSDGWVQLSNAANYPNGVYVRSDLANLPLQVGIAQAMFNTTTGTGDYFTDFELKGPNVAPPPAMPPDPSNVTVAPVNCTSVGLSWTTNGGDGSLVVVRANGILIGNPVQGQAYTADANFQDPNTLLSSDRSHIVYSGPATNVTVSGLGGSNNTYNVYVFSYSLAGGIAYNTASPASNSFAGPGVVTNVTFTVSPTNLPAGGAGLATIFAYYCGGDSYNVSSDPNATLTSSDPTVITINNGTMTAVTNGTATITAGYAGYFASNSVSVHTPVFSDNFGTFHDYIASGVMGTLYDGLFLNFGDVPGANKGNDNAAGKASQLSAQTNELTIEAAGSTWAVAGNDGPYLFKVVTGDFQAAVHVAAENVINNNDSGIMARLYNNTAGASEGGGGGTGGTETHVNWIKIQNGQVAMRETVDSGGTTVVNGLNTTDRYLLMQRVNSTNFLFYEKANLTDPWNPVPAATLTLAEAANNAPMEVGIEQEMRTASDGTATLDSLLIDGLGMVPPATPPPPASGLSVTLNSDLSMTFSWVAASATGSPIRSALVMRPGAPITAQPTLAEAGSIGGTGSPVNFGTGVDLGGNNWLVFATGNPAASTNVSATVKGLTPGVQYYAAVYSFTGSGGAKSFNELLPSSGATTNLQDGALLGLTVLPVPSIPLGGLQLLQVIGTYQGGATVNLSPFAQITVGNPNIIVTTNGALTGVSNGTTTVTAVYNPPSGGGFTNTVNATVRPPTFTDNFNVAHDYVLDRQTNSGWDGVYLNFGDVPESTYASGNPGQTPYAEANISSNGVLTVTNVFGGWENDENDGFFLFKYVPGDFQEAVHITQYDIVAYTFAGIAGRAYSVGTNGTDIGSPFDLNFAGGGGANGECWANITRFDEFGIGTYARLNLDNAVLQSTQPNINDGDNWLLITRSQGTNFNFYERASNTAPWHFTPLKTSYAVTNFAGVPMQVGIQWMGFGGGTPAQARFDSYMLDSSEATLQYSISGKNITLIWPAIPGLTLQSTTSLQPTNWQNVGGALAVGSFYEVTLPMTDPAQFFRLVH